MWFKSLSAVLLLSTFNTLAFYNHEGDKNILPGFHITIKSNNSNNISLDNKWNKINEVYQNFIQNDSNNLITIEINNWNEILNQKTYIKDQVYDDFKKQVANNEDLRFLQNKLNLFGTKAIGNSIATINSDPNSQIKNFGNVYIPYNDILKTKIDNGVFATISPQYEFANYFAVPYTIKPSKSLVAKSKIEERLKVIPINNDSWNPTNERQLVILAKKQNEELNINGNSSNVVNNYDLSYALINHKSSDEFNQTTFTITVNDKSKTNEQKENIANLIVNLDNVTSKIAFTNNEQKLKSNKDITHDYLVFNKPHKQKNLIVMNQAHNSAKLNLFGATNWVKYNVDPKTLKIDFNHFTQVTDNETLLIKNSENSYQVYYLQQQNGNPKNINNSGQYLVVYRTFCPIFDNWINLNDGSNSSLHNGFNQYLEAISNDMTLEKLETNASQFITYYIDYRKDLGSYNFVNYFGQDKSKPWAMDPKFNEITIVNNWKIIIIAGFLILFLTLILPIVVYFFKKEKRFK